MEKMEILKVSTIRGSRLKGLEIVEIFVLPLSNNLS